MSSLDYLGNLIEKKKLYPITIFKSINGSIKFKLFNSKIMLVLDLLNYNPVELNRKTGISENISKKITEEARRIYEVKMRKYSLRDGNI